jgi:hypothetical protein
VEVRCPVGPRKLFTKLKLGEEFARRVEPGNLIEFTCSDCARRIGREQQRPVRVYHRFDFIGELINTVIEAIPAHTRCIDTPTD